MCKNEQNEAEREKERKELERVYECRMRNRECRSVAVDCEHAEARKRSSGPKQCKLKKKG